MLDFSVQQYRFASGLAEGIEPHQAPPGTLLTAENVVWKKDGRLEKRFGTSLLATSILAGGSLSAAVRLFTRGSELCLIDGTSIYSYGSSGSVWTRIATVPDVGLLTTPIADPFTGVQSSDTCVSGDTVVTAYVPGDPTTPAAAGVSVLVSSLSTGSLLMPVTALATSALAYGVRVIIIGTTAIVVASGADANIRAWTVNLSTFAVAGPTNLKTDRNNATFQNWDARLIGGSSLFALAYDTAGVGMRLCSYDASLTLQQSALGGGASPTHVAVAGTSGESICVIYFTNTLNVDAYIANATTMASTAGPTTLDATGVAVTQVAVCRYDATNYAVAYTRNPAVGATVTSQLTTRLFTSAAAVVVNTRSCTAGVALASNPFMVNGKCYVYALNAAGVGSSAALAAPFLGNSTVLLGVYPLPDNNGTSPADLTHPYVANVETLLGAYSGARAPLPVFTAVSSTRAMGSLPFLGTFPKSQFTWRCGLRLLDVTSSASAPVDLWRAVPHNAETFISGSVLSVYDGGDCFDYGFNYAPSMATLSTSGAGGSIAAGAYLYAAYPEYRGASGLLYRGPTVQPLALTTAGATSTNTLRLCNVNVGNKTHAQTERFTTSLPVFRSTVGGTVPQRLTEEPTYNLSPVSYAATNQLYTDTRADAAIDTATIPATLASRPALYTTGGILDDGQPPANVTMFLHVDRLWVLAGDLKTWWYSKSFQDDLGTAPGFHVQFRISFSDVQVAGASMDDKAIFFSATGVKYMLGTGPAPNGLNSDFQTPTTIQSDVGCTNARSVVTTPDGVMFLSDRGIYLLDRGMTLSWIGRDVKDTLAAFPTVTSAVLVAKQNQVRFTCNNAGGTAGCTLVYDYVYRRWTTFRHAQGVAGANGIAIADACMWNGAWTFVTAAGQVYTESSTSYLDGGGWVPITLETSWITPPPSQASPSSGPLKFQSVREFSIHGVSNTDHDLTIAVGFDTDPSYPQTVTFAATTPVVAVGPLEECSITIGTRRKCSAIRFKITDASPSAGTLSTGQGPSLDMMGLETGAKRGFGNTLATKKG